MNPTKTPFESAFCEKKVQIIKNVEPSNLHYEGQPEFVQYVRINGKELALLGLEDSSMINQSSLQGKIFHTVNMTLPPGLKMLKTGDFFAYLDQEPNRGIGSIPHEDLSNYFYQGELGSRVMLPVLSNIRNVPVEFRTDPESFTEPIHFCDPRLGWRGFLGWCDFVILNPSVTNSTVWKYSPLIFYLPKPNSSTASRDDDFWAPWNRLESIFEPHASGYFLLPMENPDGGFSYFCLPNLDHYCYQFSTEGVRSILWNWIRTCSDLDADEHVPIVSIEDPMALCIDKWNACLFRNVSMPASF